MIDGFREIQNDHSLDPKVKGIKDIEFTAIRIPNNKIDKMTEGISNFKSVYMNEVKETLSLKSNMERYKQ